MADEDQAAATAEPGAAPAETGGEGAVPDAQAASGDAQPDLADAAADPADPAADPATAEDPEDGEDDGGIAAAAAALDADVERAFAFDTLTGPARATARRFHGLARHVVAVLPAGNARTVAIAKLRKARGAVLRPMLDD